MEPGNLCSFCDNVLSGDVSKCNICEADFTPKSKIDSTNDIVVQNSIDNGDINLQCDNDTSKPIRESSVSMETNEILPENSLVDSKWICPQCTFVNDYDLVCCAVCYVEKVASTSVEAVVTEVNLHWTCDDCQFYNNPDNVFCEICFNSKIPIDDVKQSISCVVEATPNDSYHEERIFQSEGCLPSSQVSAKPRRRSSNLNFVSSISQWMNLNRWQCRNSSCYKANCAKLSKCKRCGMDKDVESQMEPITEENLTANGKSLEPKKSKFKFRLKMRKPKKWFCSDVNCRSENKCKHESCQRCGRHRYAGHVDGTDRLG